MNYYIKEQLVDETQSRTAGNKARDDIESILLDNDFKPITVDIIRNKDENILNKIFTHKKIAQEWDKKTSELKSGDVLFIQFPCIEHSLYLFKVLRNLKTKGVKAVLIIHDLELMRISRRKNTPLKKKIRLKIEELNCLKSASIVVAHNKNMMLYLETLGLNEDNVLILGIFDYLIPNYERKASKSNSIIVAGNLSYMKAEYIYKWPANIDINLYGVNYEEKEKSNVKYCGSYSPNDLPNVLEGAFGLVWDGDSLETCSGVYGEYLKINNPHKTSLFLASGLPVFIWKDAALAEFIKLNKCGILIESIRQIPDILANLNAEDYRLMKSNAEIIGQNIRNGYYTKSIINNVLDND